MQLNQATDYAFRAVLVLASLQPGEVIDARTIASAERIPMRFLLRILRSLVKAGIAVSQRGVGGGYALARPPEEVTLLDVVEAVEGPTRVNRCLLDPEYCSKRWASRCPVHRALAGVQSALRHELARHDFAELTRGAKADQSSGYSRG
ncbi:MAG: RrF2 family transcriptional regulator [Betaproteobacteria bacterium]